MKPSKTTLFALMVIFISPAPLCAHGVKGSVQDGGLAVTARYETGEAMSYAKVSIAAPGAELPFQSGRTDRNGCFCFFPDTAGEWTVVVDDEMGHRLEVNVPTNDAMKLKTNAVTGKAEGALSKYEKVLIGIGIIFGGSGFFFWYLGLRGRKNSMES